MSIYGFLAPFLAFNFFHNQSLVAGLLSTFGVYLFGFLARPLGALFFGHIGDRQGRKKALVISIILMAVATTLIGFLPTYQHVGMLATLLLVMMRLFQGFSVGGEYTGSVLFLVEHAKPGRRGYAGSCAMMGGNLGTLIASAVCWILTYSVAHHAVLQWGWRIPFMLAMLGGIVGLYFRLHVTDTAVFQRIKAAQTARTPPPFISMFRSHLKELLFILCLTWMGVVVTYLVFVYMTTYMSTVLHYHLVDALMIDTVSMLVVVIIIPIAGLVSDRVGRKPIMMFGALGVAIAIIPYFYVLQLGYLSLAFIAQLIIAVPAACFFAVCPVAMVEMVPAEVRYSVSSFGYNVGAAIFGGTTPLIAMLLIHETHNQLSPSYYLIVCAIITFTACIFMTETKTTETEMSEANL